MNDAMMGDFLPESEFMDLEKQKFIVPEPYPSREMVEIGRAEIVAAMEKSGWRVHKGANGTMFTKSNIEMPYLSVLHHLRMFETTLDEIMSKVEECYFDTRRVYVETAKELGWPNVS